MDDAVRQATAFRVANFNPGIKGTRRNFRVRLTDWQGQLWMVAKDVGEAIGWHPDTWRHRREQALNGHQWGYASTPTARGTQMMGLVSKEALSELVKGSTARQARAFRRWLVAL